MEYECNIKMCNIVPLLCYNCIFIHLVICIFGRESKLPTYVQQNRKHLDKCNFYAKQKMVPYLSKLKAHGCWGFFDITGLF